MARLTASAFVIGLALALASYGAVICPWVSR